MEPRYADWIDLNVNKYDFGHCVETTLAMQKEFPELKRVRGHAWMAGSPRPYPHWWLVCPMGNVIDPTESQFGTVLFYEEWNEGDEEPTGKCAGCGEYTFRGKSFCSDECHDDVISDLNDSIRNGLATNG